MVVFGADAIVGVAAGAGMALLLNHLWHWDDYSQLTTNAKMDIDKLVDAYESLMRAFLHLPHPIELLEDQANEALLCRWKEAAKQMNQKVLDAQAAIRKDKAYYDECWFDCGDPVPTIVIMDLGHIENRMEEMNTVLDGFLDCYPTCAPDVMHSSWDSISDDAFHICIGLRHAMCDFPNNELFCHRAMQHPCKRWSTTTGTVAIMELPAIQNAGTVSMPPTIQSATGMVSMQPLAIQNAGILVAEADSCGRTLHTANDVKQLVRCTLALISSQGRAVDKLKQQLSSIFLWTVAVVMAAWVGIMLPCGSSQDQYRQHGRQRPLRNADYGRQRPLCNDEYGRQSPLRNEDYDSQRPLRNDEYQLIDDCDDASDANPVWDAAVKYLPPLVLSIAMLACGIVLASKWAVDTDADKIGEVSLWLHTILDDLDDLDDLLASNPQGWALTNFSVLAKDVSTSIATAIHRHWQSPFIAAIVDV